MCCVCRETPAILLRERAPFHNSPFFINYNRGKEVLPQSGKMRMQKRLYDMAQTVSYSRSVFCMQRFSHNQVFRLSDFGGSCICTLPSHGQTTMAAFALHTDSHNTANGKAPESHRLPFGRGGSLRPTPARGKAIVMIKIHFYYTPPNKITKHTYLLFVEYIAVLTRLHRLISNFPHDNEYRRRLFSLPCRRKGGRCRFPFLFVF